ncbi:MAG: hypothetical protein J5728_02900, partial [Lachnospiraceae bacterium]|nr:hypothetical protein [Lachnospiraceae bacterium]
MSTGRTKDTAADVLLKLSLFAVTLGWGLLFALRLNVPPVVDEVGTVSNTALLMGWDWSETAYAMGGSYFKYGFALLYYPLTLLIGDSYVLYKSMLALNMVFFALIPVFTYDIMHRHIGSDKAESTMLSLMMAVFPSTVLYMTYAKADVILIFLPFPIVYLLLELGQLRTKGVEPALAKKNKRRRVWLSILLAALTMYAYMSHTRGVVIVLAVVFAIIAVRIFCRIPTVEYISFLATSGLLFYVDTRAAAYFKDAIYGVYGTAYSSAESYDFETLKMIFTKSGIGPFAKLVAGTAFNSLVSSYGLVAIAMIGGLILFFRYLKSRSAATDGEMIFVIFTGLLFLGTFAMSCIYFFSYIYPFFTGENVRRSDWLVYGRYTACSAGLAVLLGLYLLIRKMKAKGIVTKLLSIIAYAGVFVAFIIKTAPHIVGVSAVMRNFIQLCTFFTLNSYGITTTVPEEPVSAFFKAGLLAAGAGLLMIAISFITDSERRLKAAFITVIFTILSVTLTLINYNKIRISRDEVLKAWIEQPCGMLEEVKELADEYPVLVDASAKSIKHYQFVCKEFTLGSSLTKTAEAKNCFIVAKKKYFVKDFYEDDYYVFDEFNYTDAKKDIVYIKGEELAEKLKEMGVSVSKYK